MFKLVREILKELREIKKLLKVIESNQEQHIDQSWTGDHEFKLPDSGAHDHSDLISNDLRHLYLSTNK